MNRTKDECEEKKSQNNERSGVSGDEEKKH